MSIFLTPSAAYGCFNLLPILEQQNLKSQELASLNFGPIKTAKIIDHAVSLDWIKENDNGFVTLTEHGKFCHSLSDTKRKLRYLLKNYFLRRHDPWLQLAKRGRSHVLLHAPPEILQLFHEAELAIHSDQDTINFWDELAALMREGKNKKNLETGRIGERLTILFETQRTGFVPDWMALESNDYGYDVLTRHSKADKTPLKIETKCSLSPISSAKFHLTRFEWKTAERSKNYNFHIWDASEKIKKLAILTVSEVARHIPMNQNGGSWEIVEIPFNLFDFQSTPINLLT